MHFINDFNGIKQYVLENEYLKVSIIQYGARIQKLEVKKDNKLIDVVLGYDSLKEYEEDKDTYFGAIIGRFANRIENGICHLNGKELHLAANSCGNHLHGGKVGFDSKLFNGEFINDDLVMSITSPDNEENYPGNLTLKVTYSLEKNTLKIHYEAISDKDTICNFTNHSYFNLNGHNQGSILNHRVKLNSSNYTPIKSNMIPTGEIASVKNTPFDFTNEKAIKEAFIDNEQIKIANGIDHNFALDSNNVGYVIGDKSNIKMSIYTTLPGMQIYTGNFLNVTKGKDNSKYSPNEAVCFETQLFPDSINHSNFRTPVLKANEKYDEITSFTFK